MNDGPERCPAVRQPEISRPRIRFMTPEESKISFHMRAETIVRIAHGRRLPPLTTPRPRKTFAMISAIATPRTVCKRTDMMVIMVALGKAFREPVHRAPVPLEPGSGRLAQSIRTDVLEAV